MGLLGNLLSDAMTKGIGKAADAIGEVAKKAQDAVTEAAASAASATAENAEKKELTSEEQEQAAKAAETLKGFGAMFSGAVEMAKREAAAEEAARREAEAAIFDNWAETLSAYPVWDVGGSAFELEELTPMNGHPAYSLRLTGRPFLVEQYAAKLRADGFIAMHCSNPADLNADTYYKMIDGVCHAFNRTDACMDSHISVSFYVDSYVPKPKVEPRQAPADLKGVAKGLFKKLIG